MERVPQPHSKQEKETETSQIDFNLETKNRFKYIVAGIVGAAISVGVAVKTYEDYSQELNEPRIEYLQKDIFNLDELSQDFENGLQVKSESGNYIIHIAQIHGFGGIKDAGTKKHPDFFYEPQKKIEKLILKLKDKYGIEIYFMEGDAVRQSAAPGFNAVQEVPKYVLTTPEEFNKSGETIIAAYLKNHHRMDTHKDGRNSFEDWKYRTYLSLNNMHSYYSQKDDPQSIKLSKETKEACDEILRENPHIEKDAYYRDGSAHWLAEQGKITLLPAETEVGNARPQDKDLSKQIQHKAVFEDRENIAVSLGIQYMAKTNSKYIPIIYGKGHDFSNSVKSFNSLQKNPQYKVGLIRIEEKNLSQKKLADLLD